MVMITGLREELAYKLFHGGIVKFGAFRLKLHEKHPDAPLSPIYIDLRILRSLPDTMNSAAYAYQFLISDLGICPDYYVDVPTSVTPVVAVMSCKFHKPMISPRMDAKTHGLTRSIDGIFKWGKTALLIDDLITTADSKLEVISILKDNGLAVVDVIALIDREQGGVQKLNSLGYTCHAVFGLTELLRFYAVHDLISWEIYEQVLAYLGTSQPK
jgi:uridine monophosphate synthetase